MTLKGSKGVFGMVNGANYGFGSPDATYNQGKIEINGALNLSVYSDTRAGGVIAGSWFGNTGAGSTTGNIKFGRIGSANAIDISGGQRDSMYGSDDDKMVGILGYSTMSSEKALIKHWAAQVSPSTLERVLCAQMLTEARSAFMQLEFGYYL